MAKSFPFQQASTSTFDGERSRFREYKYGLPQGSRLSPILFNIFMSDILKEHDLSEFVDVGVYADDVRISAFGRSSIEAAGRLSSVLLQVALWARKTEYVSM